jgi:hypothetical protein
MEFSLFYRVEIRQEKQDIVLTYNVHYYVLILIQTERDESVSLTVGYLFEIK